MKFKKKIKKITRGQFICNTRLQQGQPIIYDSTICNSGQMIREWPDGKKELITISHTGKILPLYEIN